MNTTGYVACIEDDEPVRIALVGLLEAFGYQAKGYSCAEDFLESNLLSQTSCVITDFKLEGMSGSDLLEYLKRAKHDLPTVMISAYGEEWIRAKAFAAGAVAFLNKPIDGNTLISSVIKALESAQGGA